MGPKINKRGAEESEHAEAILTLPIDASALFTVDQFVQREDDEVSADQPTYVYVVRPQNLWQALIPKRFSRFEYRRITYMLQDTFKFRGSGPSPKTGIARILEIRALDENHVFLRVFLLLPARDITDFQPPRLLPDSQDLLPSPEQLARELIATNQMVIINARSLEGRAEVTHVDSHNGGSIPEEGHWWRYRWDFGNKRSS